jgi:hypothetical protein
VSVRPAYACRRFDPAEVPESRIGGNNPASATTTQGQGCGGTVGEEVQPMSDAEARFTELYEKSYPRVLAYAMRRASPDGAREAADETFTRRS